MGAIGKVVFPEYAKENVQNQTNKVTNNENKKEEK